MPGPGMDRLGDEQFLRVEDARKPGRRIDIIGLGSHRLARTGIAEQFRASSNRENSLSRCSNAPFHANRCPLRSKILQVARALVVAPVSASRPAHLPDFTRLNEQSEPERLDKTPRPLNAKRPRNHEQGTRALLALTRPAPCTAPALTSPCRRAATRDSHSAGETMMKTTIIGVLIAMAIAPLRRLRLQALSRFPSSWSTVPSWTPRAGRRSMTS